MWSHKQLSKMRQLSWSDWGLLLEAAVWLAFSRLALLLVPFKQISPHLGTLQHESDSHILPTAEQAAERIGWAVRAIAHRTPWESACLAQAISAKAMLRRRHITSTLYLGLAKDSGQKLQAHAWLRCGAEVLTGKAGHERFSVISSFAEKTVPDERQAKVENEIVTNMHILLLAVLNPIPQTATARKLRQLSNADWPTLVEIATQQRVQTLFLAQLRALEMETAVPPHLLIKMQQQYQQVILQNLAIYRELRLINEKMQAANIPMIVLKGTYLATAVYPHIGQRAVGDLDILLPEDKIEQAVDLMHDLDWREIQPFALEAIQKNLHHLPPFAKQGMYFPVEIHWNIVRPRDDLNISADELWVKPALTSLAGPEILAFPPYLQLLHLALHAAYNHHFAFDLRSLCDIAQIINQQVGSIDWDLFADKAIAWRWQRGIYLTLKLVQAFWDTAVPPHILAQLKPEQMADHLIEMARQQLLWGRTNNIGITTNFSQLKSSKSVPDKAKFILSFIFPTKEFLSSRYGVSPKSAKVWLYYLINFRDVIKRNTIRTWRLLRGQKTITDAVSRRYQLSEWLAETK